MLDNSEVSPITISQRPLSLSFNSQGSAHPFRDSLNAQFPFFFYSSLIATDNTGAWSRANVYNYERALTSKHIKKYAAFWSCMYIMKIGYSIRSYYWSFHAPTFQAFVECNIWNGYFIPEMLNAVNSLTLGFPCRLERKEMRMQKEKIFNLFPGSKYVAITWRWRFRVVDEFSMGDVCIVSVINSSSSSSTFVCSAF